jgi:hypothetical protein
MLITEKKLRKIIKNVISENYEENEYYSSGSSLEDSLEQGNPDPERYSFDSHGYEDDIIDTGFKVVTINGVRHYEDQHTDEIVSEDEFNKRIGNVDFDYPQTYDENEIQSTQPDLYDMPKGGYDEDGNILPYDLD